MSCVPPLHGDLSACKKDESHFFEDVYFLVADTIFRLPRHHFEQDSPKFREMFGLPGSPNTSGPKENPLHRLTDINIDEFRQFLRVLYPRRFDEEKLSPQQWISVLKLATTWGFLKIRKMAIKALEEVKSSGTKGGLNLLVLAQTYDIKEWLLPALRLLAEKEDFKEEYVKQLTLPTSIKVISLQGLVAGYRLQKSAKPGKGEISQGEIDNLIKRVFPDVDTARANGSANEDSEGSSTSGSNANGGASSNGNTQANGHSSRA